MDSKAQTVATSSKAISAPACLMLELNAPHNAENITVLQWGDQVKLDGSKYAVS